MARQTTTRRGWRSAAACLFFGCVLVLAPARPLSEAQSTPEPGPATSGDVVAPELVVSGGLVQTGEFAPASRILSAEIMATDLLESDTGVAVVEVDVDGETVESKDLDCAESCPREAMTSFAFDRSEWRPGEHEITFRARDASGNETERSVIADVPAETSATCPSVDPVSPPSGEGADATAAGSIPTDLLAPSKAAFDRRAAGWLDPALRRGGGVQGALSLMGSSTTGTVGTVPGGAIDLDSTVCLVPLETTPSAAPARLEGPAAAVFANSAPSTDTIVRPSAGGMTVVQVARGEDAPSSFSWKAGLPDGARLVPLEAGGIAIVSEGDGASEPRVPAAPDPGAGLESLADTRFGIASQRHEVAAAEAETGFETLGVISAVGEGEDSALTLKGGDTVTLARPEGTRFVALRVDGAPRNANPPEAWRSYPLNQVNANLAAQAQQDACDFEANQSDSGRRALLIFLVGRVNRKNGKFGVGSDDRFRPNNRVYRALLAAGEAYQACRPSPSKTVDIAYGVTNYELSQHVATPKIAFDAGSAQAGVAKKLQKTLPDGVGGAVAGDIEPGWDPRGSGLAVNLALGGAGTGPAYYNFGTVGQCRPFGSGCQGNWSYTDIGQASQDKGIIALPEIYYPKQAKTWARVANRWDLIPGRCAKYQKRDCYSFGGVTSHPTGCHGVKYKPRESWLRMKRATRRKVARRIIYFNPRRVGCP